MTSTSQPHGDGRLVIDIRQEFHAPAERVFHRWIDADALARWFAPPGYVTAYSETDPQPGGRWRLDFHAQSGQHHYTEHGVFHEVDPFARLVLTLIQVDGDHTSPETLVTVDLEDIGSAEAPRTRMRFTQSGYRSPALRDANEQGWHGCFAALTRAIDVESDDSEGIIPR